MHPSGVEPTAAPREYPSPGRIVLVTGPSGAGRSTALAVLEDLGFEVIDNLPLSLVPRLLDGPHLMRPLVLSLDVRNRDFSVAALLDIVDWLTARATPVELLYLDADARVLQRRFAETRRRHPMAPAETAQQGIERELDLLAPVRVRAGLLIDTSTLTPHDLKAELARWFAPDAGQRLAVMLNSFSYKRGIPRGADMVFDCRFLSNPYWQADLRALDGRCDKVAAFISQDGQYTPFLEKVNDILAFLLPAYLAEGKSYLSVGFGCTGGQHRSVAVTEAVARELSVTGWQVSVRHHELEQKGRVTGAQGSGVDR